MMHKPRLTVVLIATVILCLSLTGQAAAIDPGDIFFPGPIIPIPDILLGKEITTVQQLRDIEKNPTGRYVLKADLDLGDKSWEPLGLSAGGFQGRFDGNGHTISGLRADKGQSAGLFSALGDGAVVRNLTVKGKVNASGAGGLLAGHVSAGATVEDCAVEGTVTGEGAVGQKIGGLATVNEGTIKNCTAAVTVTGGSEAGGLVGINQGSIVSAHASGSVTASHYAGGIAGINRGTIADSESSVRVFSQQGSAGGVAAESRGAIENSSATGAVFGAANTGGLVGNNQAGNIMRSSASGAVAGTIRVGGLAGFSEGGTISRSSASGTVSGDESVGGLVGQTNIHYGLKGGEPVPTIEDSYALSHVTGQKHAGGLVGLNKGAIVRRTYAAGKVTGTTNAAGLIGWNDGDLTVVASRWDSEATGQSSGIGGAAVGGGIKGLATAAMHDPASYESWDFDIVWGIEAGKTYPELGNPGIRGQLGASFADTKGHWAEAEILQLANSGVVNGIGGGLFNPDGSVTRAEFAKMIVLGVGLAPQPAPHLTFADTAQIPDWAHGYVATAVRAGIIKGLDGNRFGPAQLITREQIAVMVVRALNVTPSGSLSAEDAAITSDWARAEVQAALERGMLLRRDAAGRGALTGALLPQAFGTRAEAARAIARLQALLRAP